MDIARPEKIRAVKEYLTKDKAIMYLTKHSMNQSQLASMFGVSPDWMEGYIKRLHINIQHERDKYNSSLPKTTKPIGRPYLYNFINIIKGRNVL